MNQQTNEILKKHASIASYMSHQVVHKFPTNLLS